MKAKVVSMSLGLEVIDKLKKVAKEENRSFSNTVETLLIEKLQER